METLEGAGNMTNQIDGQMSIFDFLQQDKEEAHSSADDLRAQGFINMRDMTPPPGLYEVCDINKPNTIWQANRHEHGWENPKGKRMSYFRPIPGEWLKGHGKRIFFDDIKEGSYYLADQSTESMKCYKVAYVKQKVENDLRYVDSPKGIKGEWNWGNSYSCLTRKQYVDADNSNLAGASATNGYWYEIGPMITESELLNTPKEDLITESVSPQEEYKESVNKQPVTKHICKHSEHECNKAELWKVADSLDETQCPHVCCRQCNTRGCGARCNGSTEPKKETKKYPNCSQAEIDYILPILRVDACTNMRERIYKDYTSGMSDENLIKCIKYFYRDWRREKSVEHEHVFNFSKDMLYHAAITYPDGMELRKKPGDTHGCNVNTWSHVLVMIKDMIAAGDYVEVPEVKTKPVVDGYTCQYDHTCWCNRYGHESPIEEYKTDLIKGYSCAGCCHNCKESPIYGGKCKWDCRLKKGES